MNHVAIPDVAAPLPAPITEASQGQIEVELNGARLTFQGEVALKALRVVMNALTK